jgi:elongator complex protein 2
LGIYALLSGHKDIVTVIRFFKFPASKEKFIVTGSVDKSIRLWEASGDQQSGYICSCVLEGHGATINAIALAQDSDIVASGAADGTVKIWRIVQSETGMSGKLLETIELKPRFFPLTLTLIRLDLEDPILPMLLTVGGTTNSIHVYVAQDSVNDVKFSHVARLTGHEAWIRSLAIIEDTRGMKGEFLLASASQDKYIRLWGIHRGKVMDKIAKDEEEAILGSEQPTLSNKAHTFEVSGKTYSITFEALLFGHDDWIYTVTWNPSPGRLQLLSTSADNSISIWEPDTVSGVWVAMERMGEISALKGSTSATGSTGGFWIGLWSPDGKQVVSLARTGSWRRWVYNDGSETWDQQMGVSGHIGSVNDLCWDAMGEYTLSTSSDQTTRLHARWLQDGLESWHEFSRPQIHGYDLNCIDSIGPAQFVSGADEKLLRVFDEPRPIAHLLKKLGSTSQEEQEDLPEAANIPVLGLSNKAIGEDLVFDEGPANGISRIPDSIPQPVSLDLDHPPLEHHLARHTLWPEHEKLYGHGYEISAVAASHNGELVATACKASSKDHAVIRLYDTSDWHEIKPYLTAHSLTITSLSFSNDNQYLLSVGRDRQWSVFKMDGNEESRYKLFASNPKGHSRMLLDATWAVRTSVPIFATAGRDKKVNIWRLSSGNFECVSSMVRDLPVTAVSFLPQERGREMLLAVGEENGQISIHGINEHGLQTGFVFSFDRSICPSKAITRLSWQPRFAPEETQSLQNVSPAPQCLLAVASEDCSVRIFEFAV